MSPLTESEKVAESWLEQRHENVKRVSEVGKPDFIADGEWFEVKKKQEKNSLVFSFAQFDGVDNPRIIVTDNGKVEDVIKLTEALEKYTICGSGTIYFTEETYSELLKNKREKENVSKYVKRIVEERLEDE